MDISRGDKINLFIDTNIFLQFYRLTDEDLSELDKLKSQIQAKHIVLFITQQVKDEFSRNREKEIKKSLDSMKKLKINQSYPSMMRHGDDFEELQKLKKDFNSKLDSITDKLRNQIDGRTLKADALIDELFHLGEMIESSDEIFNKADKRMKLGNPPGKEKCLKDGINWEILLNHNFTEQLNFIVADTDYWCPISKDGKPRYFLSEEWSEIKDTEIKFYESLSKFFSENSSLEIQLTSNTAVTEAINMLTTSGGFRQTHLAITELNSLITSEVFTQENVDSIMQGAIDNPQIYRIILDEEILIFYESLLTNYEGSCDKSLATRIKGLIKHKIEEANDQQERIFG